MHLLLETTLSAAQETLMQSQSEAQQLKSSVKKLESQLETYKRKVQLISTPECGLYFNLMRSQGVIIQQ